MTTLDTLLAEIRARLERATPKYMTSHQKMRHLKDNYLIGVDCCDEEPFVIAEMNQHMDNRQNDLQLIAHAPTDIERLLKVIDRLREQRDGWIREDQWQDGFIRDHDAELAAILKGERT